MVDVSSVLAQPASRDLCIGALDMDGLDRQQVPCFWLSRRGTSDDVEGKSAQGEGSGDKVCIVYFVGGGYGGFSRGGF
jgi:hypothetical protein